MNNSNLEFRKVKSLKFLYEVNENGTILRNVKSKKQIKIKLEENGYVGFIKSKKIMIDKIVAECWLGEYLQNKKLSHIDGNIYNNDYRNLRYIGQKKPVLLNNIYFESYAAAARHISQTTILTFEAARSRLKAKRKKILMYDITYLNAETKHTRSTEQEIVHYKNDLTGDYKTAFNEGKQAEVEERVKHTGLEIGE